MKAAILNDVVVLKKIYKNGERVELTMTLHIRVSLKIKKSFFRPGHLLIVRDKCGLGASKVPFPNPKRPFSVIFGPNLNTVTTL